MSVLYIILNMFVLYIILDMFVLYIILDMFMLYIILKCRFRSHSSAIGFIFYYSFVSNFSYRINDGKEANANDLLLRVQARP